MGTGLTIVIFIAIVGMSLVFLSIIFLWVIIEFLVRINPPEKSESTNTWKIALTEKSLTNTDSPIEYIVAVAAVSVALADRADHSRPHVFPLPPTALVSAWQAVMRTKILSKRGLIR